MSKGILLGLRIRRGCGYFTATGVVQIGQEDIENHGIN